MQLLPSTCNQLIKPHKVKERYPGAGGMAQHLRDCSSRTQIQFPAPTGHLTTVPSYSSRESHRNTCRTLIYRRVRSPYTKTNPSLRALFIYNPKRETLPNEHRADGSVGEVLTAQACRLFGSPAPPHFSRAQQHTSIILARKRLTDAFLELTGSLAKLVKSGSM